MLWWLLACEPNFADVQRVDTIEAYEEYLKSATDAASVLEARKRLDELYWEQAKNAGTREALEAFSKDHPDSKFAVEATVQRERIAFDEASRANSIDGWKRYLDEYPAHRIHSGFAKDMIEVLEYGGIVLGDPEVVEVNMAEDPKGPLNGWGVNVEVTNTGDKTLKVVKLTVEYLDTSGAPIDSDAWPLVHFQYNVPMPDIAYTPMKPGEKRKWEWTKKKESHPAEWATGKVRVSVTQIAFAS